MSCPYLSFALATLVSSLAPSLVLATPQAHETTPIAPGRPVPVDPQLAPGSLALKPDGSGVFIADAHHGGGASQLHLLDMKWGRLVDVLALDANGKIDPKPVLRDFAIGETVQNDASRWRLADHLGTQRQRLVILRTRGAPEPSPGAGTFDSLLAEAASSLVPIAPKAENAAPPFSSVARNAVLVARFDDLLRDSPDAATALVDNVRVRAGLPGGFPFQARVVFDPNHGGILRGKFHSTRVLVDLTVSEFELEESSVPLPLNVLGLPAGDGPDGASASVHIPTVIDLGGGQFSILTNFAGRGLPVPGGPGTTDLVRAFGTGGEGDAYNGFLLDVQEPTLVGQLFATVQAVDPDPAGELGFAFLVDWTYAENCALRPLQGSVLLVGEHVLELVVNGPTLGLGGTVTNARVRLEGHEPISPAELLGNATVLLRLRASALDQACWVRFSPAAGVLPGTDVDPASQVLARFNEPLDPGSVRPHDSLRIVRGDASVPPDPHSIVAAQVLSSSDLGTFVVSPLLPLTHVQGEATPYHVQVVNGSHGVRDLAGNPLALPLPAAEFTLTPGATSEDTGSVVLRFTSPDELAPEGADLRGQFFFDFVEERIRPRPVAFTSVPADASNPVPSIMIPFAPGVQTPLSPLGSKLHAVWRYADLGWSVRDESKYDVDVVGLAWAPVNGHVINDFFEGFEIRLAHSRFLPDEQLDTNLLPKYQNSGLRDAPNPFTANILEDPLSPQKVVHPRALGYVVNVTDLFQGASGTTLMPFPLNQGPGPIQSYTWRDTRVQAVGAPNGAGIPMDIESGAPLFLEPNHGTVAAAGQVPSIGLPLLMEFRCYPSDRGLGLNALSAMLAINSSALPSFRAFSTGGINTSGNVVVKDPDTQTVPTGGFDPSSTPPGLPTLSADNTFYIGQLDIVTRVSRVITAWIDTGVDSPDFVALVADPLYGSSGGPLPVSFEMRGAHGFTGLAAGSEFDASQMDAYGELEPTDRVPLFVGDPYAWHDDIDDIDGARFVQLRITFANDIQSGFSPSLDGLAIAFHE